MLTLMSSTLSGNSVGGFGGGILHQVGGSAITNTILAGNTAGFAGPDLFGVLTSQGHNLIGDGSGGSGFTDTDLVGTDPLLGPLQDNGGPTFTHALLPGSLALDAGDNTDAPEFDQRGPGFPRTVSGTIDIGAFEVQATVVLTASAGGPYLLNEGDPLTLNGAATGAGPLTFAWDLNGDGLFGDATGLTPTLTWADLVALGIDDGPRTLANLRLQVSDGTTTATSDPTTLTVNNVPPQGVTLTGPAQGVPGQTLPFAGDFTDPGALDTHAFLWEVTDADGQVVASGTERDFGFTPAQAGAYAVTFTVTDDDGGTASARQALQVEAIPLTTVQGVVVNDGAAQRSQVSSLTVRFSSSVTLDPSAFEVRDAAGTLVSFDLATGTDEGGLWASLAFPDFLQDGNYTLTVRGDRVADDLGRALDGDGDGTPGGDRVESFFRYFGDGDGDRDVDGDDQVLFDSTFGRSAADAGFLAYFDFDGDGDVDEADRDQFLLRLGSSLGP